MTVQALVFDLDGLIVDTEGPAFESWRSIYNEHGAELELALWQAEIGSVAMFDAVAHLESLTGRTLDRTLLLERRRQLKQTLSQDAQLLPGVQALVDAAEQAGLKLGVASSSGREWVFGWLERTGLLQRFDCVRTRDDVALPKPAPDLYRSVADCLGVAPERCVALEDSPNGLRAALAAGMRCVVVPTPLTTGLDFAGAALELAALSELELPELLERLAVQGGIEK